MIQFAPSQTQLSGFYVVYKGSTNFENEGTRGMSHLMEHLMCKAFDHLQDELAINCVDWNAYTSPGTIVFFVNGLKIGRASCRERV